MPDEPLAALVRELFAAERRVAGRHVSRWGRLRAVAALEIARRRLARAVGVDLARQPVAASFNALHAAAAAERAARDGA